jgi:hypothetical protein
VWYIEHCVLGALYEASAKTPAVGGLPGLGEKEDTKFICSMSGTWHGDDVYISTGEGEYEAKIQGNKLELYDPLYERGKKPIALLTRFGRKGPTLGAKPPERAIVLFDGSSADAWTNGRVEDGLLYGNDMRTKQAFRDYQLHLEFRTPYILPQVNTARPSSLAPPQVLAGVFHQGRYETQIRDSFCNVYFFEQPGSSLINACGAINGIAQRVNACLPSLVWQTYDAEFTAPQFDGTGKLTQPARITDQLNGVIVHIDQDLSKKTANAPVDVVVPDATPLSIIQKDYPVCYRNIWIVPK